MISAELRHGADPNAEYYINSGGGWETEPCLFVALPKRPNERARAGSRPAVSPCRSSADIPLKKQLGEQSGRERTAGLEPARARSFGLFGNATNKHGSVSQPPPLLM